MSKTSETSSVESQAPDSAELIQSGGVQSIQLSKFVRKIGKVIEQTRKENKSFLIKRHREELAILTPVKTSSTPTDERVVSTKTLALDRSIFDSVKDGQTYWLTRREKIIGVLVPPPPSWNTLTDELRDSGIPLEIIQSLLSAYREIEREIGPDDAARVVRERVVRLLDHDEARKLETCRGKDLKALEEWANKYDIEPKQLVLISPMDLQNRIGKIVDQLVDNQISFLIKRRKKELAVLTPLMRTTSIPQDRVISTQFLLKNRKILDDVSHGQTYQVSRRNKVIATLVPPPISAAHNLSVREKHDRGRNDYAERREDLVTISPMELQARIGKIIEKAVDERTSFLIKRQSKELAILTAVTEADSLPKRRKRVFTTKYIAHNRSILDEVAGGQPVWVSRRKKIVAKLVPPMPSQSTELSEVDREKLWLSRDLTIEQFRIAVQLITGEITLGDVIENKG